MNVRNVRLSYKMKTLILGVGKNVTKPEKSRSCQLHLALLLYNECSTTENNLDCMGSKLVPARKQMFQVKLVILIGAEKPLKVLIHMADWQTSTMIDNFL